VGGFSRNDNPRRHVNDHSDDELRDGLMKDHRQHPVANVYQKAAETTYSAGPWSEGTPKPRRSSTVLRGATLVAVAALCVGGLWALSGSDKKSPAPAAKPSASVSVVASAPSKAETKANLSKWQMDELGPLMAVVMDQGAMKSGDYRTNEMSQQIFCPSMVTDVQKAMDQSKPAPDEETQKHFVAMLNDYKLAGTLCVSGKQDDSFKALQDGDKEHDALTARIKEVTQ